MEYPGKKMVHRYEQVMLYSPEEFRRRIDGVAGIMKRYGADALLFPESSEEAYDEWLLGERFMKYVIVKSDATAFGVLQPSAGMFRLETPVRPGHVLSSPYCDGVQFTYYTDAEYVAGLLTSGNPSRIGLVLPDHLPASLSDAVERMIPGVEWTDLTVPVALFRAVKSPEELYTLRQARDIQAAVFGALPQIIRIGRTVEEINREMKHLLREMGASGVVHGGLICGGRQNVPAMGLGISPDHRVEYGDRFFALMEGNGPGHHHAAFGRHFVIGDIDEDWRRCVDDAARVHRYAVSLMKPHSLTLAQIAVKTRKYANSLGYTLREHTGWNWMHSLGPYYYEQYSLEDYTEDIPLEENIILHCHPQIYREFPNGIREDVFLLNTYLVEADGARDLINIPTELVSLY